ncbi:unnamed protein product [Adineta ricciae]|uniref:SAMD1-like winged helix (WH) domain-containing protein n=1 Tax=Adineta ricciae TaxID=249248 RepID=A0A814A977_ADIRI|nr:unnamed protein product [Adineta ricciae]CAF1320037.1 unnamed protein product [Adineta ricciae]
MILSPMTTINATSLSPSFSRKRNLPTPPPSLSDVNDSSSCSSLSSSSSSSIVTTTTTTIQNDTTSTIPTCDLLNILTDVRFRPVFQAIDEIKRRKCRPDFERILKYVAKRYTATNQSDQRKEILSILDDLLKYGIITKVFHKGGFTIRMKNEKYAKLIENMNICYNQKTPTATPMNPQEAMAAAATALAEQSMLNSDDIYNHHKRETPSPEFAVFITESLPQMTKENNLDSSQKKRTRSQTYPNKTKKSRLSRTPELVPEPVFRPPLLTNNNLPPITIEQLLGLRGSIPDVHRWTTDDLIQFFHQQGYDYASILLNKYRVNGDKLYELKREEVFHKSTLKIGKALKLWNVIEQIQRNTVSLSS